jgi:hypothetical protein
LGNPRNSPGMLLFPLGNLLHISILYYLRGHTVSKNKNGVTLISYIVYREDRVNLHILIDVEQTVLRKSTLFATSGNIETTNETDKGVKFLLCSACFGVPHVLLQTLLLQNAPLVVEEI